MYDHGVMIIRVQYLCHSRFVGVCFAHIDLFLTDSCSRGGMDVDGHDRPTQPRYSEVRFEYKEISQWMLPLLYLHIDLKDKGRASSCIGSTASKRQGRGTGCTSTGVQ